MSLVIYSKIIDWFRIICILHAHLGYYLCVLQLCAPKALFLGLELRLPRSVLGCQRSCCLMPVSFAHGSLAYWVVKGPYSIFDLLIFEIAYFINEVWFSIYALLYIPFHRHFSWKIAGKLVEHTFILLYPWSTVLDICDKVYGTTLKVTVSSPSSHSLVSFWPDHGQKSLGSNNRWLLLGQNFILCYVRPRSFHYFGILSRRSRGHMSVIVVYWSNIS